MPTAAMMLCLEMQSSSCGPAAAPAAAALYGVPFSAGLPANAPDADVAGWNSSSDQYTFAYLSEEDGGSTGSTAAAANSSPTKLLVKALVLGDTLLTTLATDSAAAEPQVLELSVEDYVIPPSSTDGSAAVAGGSIAKSYKNLDRLVTTLNTAMSKLVGSSPAAAAAGNPSSGSQKKQKTEVAAGASGHQGSRPPEPLQEPDPDHDPLRIGPPRRPVRVGKAAQVRSCGAPPSAPPPTSLPRFHWCTRDCTY